MKVAIIGPSGAGKTTIIDEYVRQYEDFKIARSFTTRLPRNTEDNEFIFVKKEEFENLIGENFFLEYEHIFNNYYGTPKLYLESGNIFFNVDIKGATKLKNYLKDLIIIFILPRTREHLVSRLNNRNCGSDVTKRLERVQEEIDKCYISDYFIVNDTVNQSVETLRKIIDIEYSRRDFRKIVRDF